MEYEVKPLGIFSAKQLNNAYYEMLVHLTGEMSVKEVVDYIAELLNSSVLLYTCPENKIFISCDDSRAYTSLLMLQFQLSIANNSDLYSFFRKEQTSHTATPFPNVYLDRYDSMDCDALSGDLIGPNGLVGTLCLLDVNFDALEEQEETLALFCQILAKKMCGETQFRRMERESVPMEQMDINGGAQWFRKLKGDSFQNFYIAALKSSGLGEDKIRHFKEELESDHLLFRMVVQDSLVIVLLNVRDNEEAKVMREALTRLAEIHRSTIGLSTRFHGSEHIYDGLIQATNALNTAQYTEREGQLVPFEQIAVDALLLDLIRTSSLDCYRNEGLDSLCRYDEQNGTQYYETLNRFIACGASKQKTSQALYIHRNTLSYRLERISEHLHVDLNDPDTQARLYLDIKIRELLDRAACRSPGGQPMLSPLV